MRTWKLRTGQRQELGIGSMNLEQDEEQVVMNVLPSSSTNVPIGRKYEYVETMIHVRNN
jgi:hypothetical protein